MEAKFDSVLSQKVKNSYKKLQKYWINIDYILDEKSDHDKISNNAIISIINKYK